MTIWKLGVLLVVALLLEACSAGINFVRPSDDQLIFGETTKEQIIALMGQPNAKGERFANGEYLESIAYAYAATSEKPVFEGVTPARAIGFQFHNSILVGKDLTSSFASDSTYFDPNKARAIRQGMTEREVVALLGEPGGEYRYPIISNKNGRAMVYAFAQTKGFKSQQNLLIVELDEKGRVVRIDFNQTGAL